MDASDRLALFDAAGKSQPRAQRNDRNPQIAGAKLSVFQGEAPKIKLLRRRAKAANATSPASTGETRPAANKTRCPHARSRYRWRGRCPGERLSRAEQTDKPRY